MRTVLLAAFFSTATVSISALAQVVAPVDLNPGTTVSSLPNGGSSGDGVAETTAFDKTISFSFSDGLSGALRERVIDYADAPSINHPGLYFDYEIALTTGSLSAVSITGWNSFQTSVKQCGIAVCGGSGANGLLSTGASRSSDGDEITFDFGNPLAAGKHSSNLQVFSSASLFSDPLAFLTDTSGNSFSIDVVAPALPVPEPSTWALLALGCVALGLHAYRLKNTQSH